jgi:two-component SAPR family response regulator
MSKAILGPVLDTIDESVAYLKDNTPDLIFLDIELADGSCFEIFKAIEISSPIIFTTAYNQYAIQAFEVNSVDYLLKPITKESVSNALKNL